MSNLSKLALTLGLKFGPVRKGVTPRKTLEYILNGMVMAQTDHNMASDPDTILRLEGMLEAYRDVAHYIAPYTNVTSKAGRVTRTTAKNARAAARVVAKAA